jgi:hypothetical protein
LGHTLDFGISPNKYELFLFFGARSAFVNAMKAVNRIPGTELKG